MTAAVTAYIALGSNLGVPIDRVRAGMDALHRLPETHVVQCSSLYRTAPVGITAQPDFINAVCAVETTLSADRLLRELLAIEREHGRTRGAARGGPRILDLDLLLYGDFLSDAAEITLPHPRLHERAFVLYPLHEIAPALHVPGRGSVAELLSRCTAQAVERLREGAVRPEFAS